MTPQRLDSGAHTSKSVTVVGTTPTFAAGGGFRRLRYPNDPSKRERVPDEEQPQICEGGVVVVEVVCDKEVHGEVVKIPPVDHRVGHETHEPDHSKDMHGDRPNKEMACAGESLSDDVNRPS